MFKKIFSVYWSRTPQKRTLLKEFDLLPGNTISKRVLPKIISLSEFRFKTLKNRRVWQEHYNYLNRRYGMGLKSFYINSKMVLDNISSVKKDIQYRIENNLSLKHLSKTLARCLTKRFISNILESFYTQYML
uniref:Uncharacterized protein n=1 Tax=Ostreobium quekettii TaxID=121088 RepID=A0A1A8H151_9CHLO|nr:Hypothetical protein orf131 [Ostreobium quekettii]SBQ77027.1 Hypothetical protein orf131 [Ostreobium quekettii]